MNLIILNVYDYDVNVRMNFLIKPNVMLEFQCQKVLFKLSDNDEFRVANEDQRKKMINSSMRAQEVLLSNDQGFSASVVNTAQVEKSKYRGDSNYSKFLGCNFPRSCLGYHQTE